MLSAPPLHHSEPTDPDLLDWLTHQVDRFLPFDPLVGVVVGGVLLVAIPVGLLLLAARNASRRRNEEAAQQ